MKNAELTKKLKRERVEVCLNCRHFVNCENIGKFEDCEELVEVEGEACVIKKLSH